MRPLFSSRFVFPSLVLILTLFSQTILAQSAKKSWDEVQKLKPGAMLMIKTKTGQKFKGRVATISADSITISPSKSSGNDIEVKRETIAEIRKKSGARTSGYAAVLGSVGFAGGYGVGYGVGEAKNARFRPEYVTAAAGAAVGAVVGAIMGSRGEVIYKGP